MKSYYLLDGETQLGPFSLKELKAMPLTPNSRVWDQDEKDWVRAADLKELRFLFPQANSYSNQAVFPKISPNKEESIDTIDADQGKAEPRHANNLNEPNSFRTEPSDLPLQPAINPKLVAFALGLAIVIILSLINFSGGGAALSTAATGSMSVEHSEKTIIKETNQDRLDSLEKLELERKNEKSSIERKNKIFRNSWKNYISHTPSNYKIKGFGGISGLSITVINKSEKIIDEIVVNVTYFKNDGSIFEVKEVSFYNIQPHSQKQSKVPNTQRGTKLKTEISKVSSRSYQFCYDSSNGGGSGTGDPWLCK